MNIKIFSHVGIHEFLSFSYQKNVLPHESHFQVIQTISRQKKKHFGELASKYWNTMWIMPQGRFLGSLWFVHAFHVQFSSTRCGACLSASKNNTVNLILRLFLYHFFTYDELVTSGVHSQQHKQPTNTTTMVMEPLPPPAAWIQWIHTVQVAGSLAHVCFEAAVEGFW